MTDLARAAAQHETDRNASLWALRALLWLVLREAQRAGMPEVIAEASRLHSMVVERCKGVPRP